MMKTTEQEPRGCLCCTFHRWNLFEREIADHVHPKVKGNAGIMIEITPPPSTWIPDSAFVTSQDSIA